MEVISRGKLEFFPSFSVLYTLECVGGPNAVFRWGYWEATFSGIVRHPVQVIRKKTSVICQLFVKILCK